MSDHPDSGCHMLVVVDDEERMRRIVADTLRRDGYDVLEAADTVQADAILQQRLPCMMLVDVGLPGMDGLSYCARLKQDPRTAHIPVALITGRDRREDVKAGLAAGAVDYIKKPFDKDEMRLRVRSQLRVREELRERQRVEQELRTVASAVHDAIVVMDDGGLVTMWNDAATRMFGFAPSEIVGKRLHDLIAPARVRPAHEAALLWFRETGQGPAVGRTLELTALRKSGEEFPVELSLAATQLSGRWHAVGVVRDITERKRADDLLRRSEARLTTILDRMEVGVAIIGLDRRIRWANAAALDLAGVDRVGALAAQPCTDWLCNAEPNRCPVLDLGQRVERSERILRHRDGFTIPILKSVFEIEFDGERALLETFVDLRERKQLETELGHARKLEAVGQLAAGIAHEINTPTQYVGDSVHFLRDAFDAQRRLIAKYREAVDRLRAVGGHDDFVREVEDLEEEVDLAYIDEAVPGCFDRSFDGIERISKIVRAMKEFAHPGQSEKSPADINQALTSTLTIARNEYKYVADVETAFGDLPPVSCHIGELNQVFLNLLVNAAHAISDVVGGTGNRGVIRVSTEVDGDAVVIEIQDTGAGIPESIRDRVFEPFFTTKEVGRGSGQGLAIARSVVVDKHGGSITFDSVVGQGTTFRIRLPIDGGPRSRPMRDA